MASFLSCAAAAVASRKATARTNDDRIGNYSMMKPLTRNAIPHTETASVDEDDDRGHALPHPEEAPGGVHRGVAQEPPHGDPPGRRGPQADGARTAQRGVHGLGRRLADA